MGKLGCFTVLMLLVIAPFAWPVFVLGGLAVLVVWFVLELFTTNSTPRSEYLAARVRLARLLETYPDQDSAGYRKIQSAMDDLDQKLAAL